MDKKFQTPYCIDRRTRGEISKIDGVRLIGKGFGGGYDIISNERIERTTRIE